MALIYRSHKYFCFHLKSKKKPLKYLKLGVRIGVTGAALIKTALQKRLLPAVGWIRGGPEEL